MGAAVGGGGGGGLGCGDEKRSDTDKNERFEQGRWDRERAKEEAFYTLGAGRGAARAWKIGH